MITEIDASLLEKIADLTGKPVGAFNIRKDMGCEARQSTEHIAIDLLSLFLRYLHKNIDNV